MQTASFKEGHISQILELQMLIKLGYKVMAARALDLGIEEMMRRGEIG